jgi:HEAT repeats
MKAVAAVPPLIHVLEQGKGAGRDEAAGALGSIGDERAAPALRAALEDDDLEVQAAAHWALGELGSDFAPADALSRHERQLLEAVQDAAREELDADVATIEVRRPDDGPASFELEPRRPGACPVTVQADDTRQVSLFIGRHDTWWEVWEADRRALLRWVSETVRGILQGRYEEWVRAGESRAAVGVLHLPDGDRMIRKNVLRGRPRGADHLTYEPYL